MYVDNELYTGACAHQHDDWNIKLRTLSAISKASHRFRELVAPLVYRVYPGQTLVNPELFLARCKANESHANDVKELVIDPWNALSSQKTAVKEIKTLGFGGQLIATLEKHAREWQDEEHALLLLLRCPNVEVLDTTSPSALSKDSSVSLLFEKVRVLGLDISTKGTTSLENQENLSFQLPIRKLDQVHLHHAENMYVRSTEAFESLMRLATIRSLTAYRFWDKGGSLGVVGSNVQQLTLWRCSFQPHELLADLSACTGLQSLHIICAGFQAILDKLVPDKWSATDFRRLSELVRTKLQNLQTLRIDDRELQELQPVILGSFKSGPKLEHLSVNEASLATYDLPKKSGNTTISGSKAIAAMARLGLADMLPSTLQSLSILKSNARWHEENSQGQPLALEKDGLTYKSHAIRDKVFDLISRDLDAYPQLTSIHIDTPLSFGKNIASSDGRHSV